ncbi:MAG: acyltransferase [Gammaproteobacteria bacterium]
MIAFHHRLFRALLARRVRLAERLAKLKYRLVGQIEIAPSVKFSPKARIEINRNFSRDVLVDIGSATTIKDYAILAPRDGYINIGVNCSVNPFCVLLGYGGIDIGDNVRMAAGCSIIAFNHNFDDPTVPIAEQGNNFEGIRIEDDVWLGTGVRVLDGVVIGKGAVVGAGSVVTRSIPPGCVAVGVPAKVIKSRVAPR